MKLMLMAFFVHLASIGVQRSGEGQMGNEIF